MAASRRSFRLDGAPTLASTFAASRGRAAGLGTARRPAGVSLVDFLVKIPFVELLGFELLRFECGETEIACEVREELTNSWGVAHGGLTMDAARRGDGTCRPQP